MYIKSSIYYYFLFSFILNMIYFKKVKSEILHIIIYKNKVFNNWKFIFETNNVFLYLCHIRLTFYYRSRRGHDRMVVGYTTTYAISTYPHWCEFESRSGSGVQHYVIKFVSDLWQVSGFLWVLWFPPPGKLTTTTKLKYC